MKDKAINILIFPAGTENAIEIWNSLKYIKFINLYGCSNDSKNHIDFIFKERKKIKNVSEIGWIEELNSYLEEKKIDYIYPANSIVIDYLNEYRELIKAQILLPSKETIYNTRSKKQTYDILKNYDFIAKYYNFQEVEKAEFPLYAKPDKGYGGQGAILVKSLNDIVNDKNKYLNYVFQEYLPGDEYTVDCFSKKDGSLVFVQGRSRERIRMGTSMHSEIVSDELNSEFRRIGQIIVNTFNIFGSWFFQMKKNREGNLKLLEIDIRIAGTMALNRVRGVNFPLLNIYEYLDIDTDILVNDKYNIIIDRSLKNRYIHNINYNKVYVDLDDTIIIKNKVNIQLISFLYQCLNEGKKIILITKSLDPDIYKYLREYRILQIFDDIIVLKEHEKKSKYISSDNAIYIDDSFSQRIDVARTCKIPTFDCSMIEMLMDERI